MKFKVIKENLDTNKARAIKAYRDYARLSEDCKITAENLNYSALSRAAENFAFPTNILKEALLNEETIE